MDDSACDGEERQQHESIWVWIKPAAFYNQLESRFKTNVTNDDIGTLSLSSCFSGICSEGIYRIGDNQ